MSENTAQKLDLKTTSERYFAAWAAHDPDAIVALHTQDTHFWAHGGTEPSSAAMRCARRSPKSSNSFRASRGRPIAFSTARTIGCSTGR